jgi:high-affinity nickel-transport protein
VRLYAVLVLANLAAWVWAWMAFSSRPALLGTALLAYVFGLRHAVDADHIAAIDNVVRKLMQQGRRPHSVGFYFSLGHSTVVFLAAAALAGAAATMQENLGWFRDLGGVVGTAISACFLVLIAVVNLGILHGTWRSFRKLSRGVSLPPDQIEQVLSGHGMLTRLFRPLFRTITQPWHMYPLGFLFGLGFDTATEIGLLGISATQAAGGMSPWQTLVFPALFTAGMALVDTADSSLMVEAYGWAFARPLRKLWYNMTITAASVVVALLIGGIEALGLLVDRWRLAGGAWDLVAALNGQLDWMGGAVIGIFVAAWAISAMVYRLLGYDRLIVE